MNQDRYVFSQVINFIDRNHSIILLENIMEIVM